MQTAGTTLVRPTVLEPHDLVWLPGADALWAPDPQPVWVRRAMALAPVVVVRRGQAPDGRIPVGVRGFTRSERFAASVDPQCVLRRVRPEELLAVLELVRTGVPALRVLNRINQAWTALALPWGPIGSAGFQLATGMPAITAASDLDLLIRAAAPLTRAQANTLLQAADGQEVAVDVQVETPFGSVSLRELAAPSCPQILMKTGQGPRLVLDPWNPEQGANP